MAKRVAWVGVSLVLLLAGCAAPAPRPVSGPVAVRLVAVNDFHGNLSTGPSLKLPSADGGEVDVPAGGAAYMAQLVQQRRDEHPGSLVVAAGDLIGASPPVSGLFHDEPAIDVLSRMGLQLSSLGNHEFDEGLVELQRMQDGGCHPRGSVGVDTCVDGPFAGAGFRYLAANVVDEAGRQPFPGSAVRELTAPGGVRLRIGLIGAVLAGTRNLVDPSGIVGLRFLDEADAINAEIPALRAQRVDAIVLLIHEGVRTSGAFDDPSCQGITGDLLPIVDRLDPAIRVVVSGHTHWAYVCERNGRLLTSGGSYARFVTTIDLSVDPQADQVVAFAARNEPVINDSRANPVAERWPSLTAQPEIAGRVALWEQRAAPITSRLVGRITADLPGPRAGQWESPLGNLIADAQLAAMRDPAHGAAQLAVMNPGGIRNPINHAPSGGEAPGEVRWGEVFSAQPFGNTVVTVSLSGAGLVRLLEQQFEGSYPRVLSVSGNVRYRFRASGPPGGRVEAGSLTLDGVPVQPEQTYRVAMNSFIANGGDGYGLAFGPGDRVNGPDDLTALLDYLAAHSPISPPELGRVQRLD